MAPKDIWHQDICADVKRKGCQTELTGRDVKTRCERKGCQRSGGIELKGRGVRSWGMKKIELKGRGVRSWGTKIELRGVGTAPG